MDTKTKKPKDAPALVIWAFWAESPRKLVTALKSIERLLGLGKKNEKPAKGALKKPRGTT